ncbi:hypothetical protein BZB76_6277 [Actinomadura pelletieri DSM 43383]|uniref:Uncharacterized protein n=1 Tax=Actinomadura pelletieri DSM 43383 TaxID=1120940 RepID=A0A495QBT4_9ACTN|nr:hypothetical protein BZB76_6277 [Actinomadura pelletieri DSM 43383]
MQDCPGCGWPDSEVYEVLSRHLTSEGVVTYTRCACGETQVRVQPFEPGTVVAARRGDAPPSDAS